MDYSFYFNYSFLRSHTGNTNFFHFHTYGTLLDIMAIQVTFLSLFMKLSQVFYSKIAVILLSKISDTK